MDKGFFKKIVEAPHQSRTYNITMATFLGALISGVILFNVHISKTTTESLNKHKGFTVGYIYEYELTTGVDYVNYIKFRYLVKNKIYKNYNGAPSSNGLGYEFVNKTFPVVFDTVEPANSRILIFPSDYKGLGMSFPDSLNWVIQLMEKYKVKE
ncbi:MAG TPA: hypothetical protein VK809_11570 [Bacteroidia bacterium]|jgi:hypothetical protein|nr:hypothetical protein [Bacteroidia bacterium]